MVDFQGIILQGIAARRSSECWDNPFYKAEAMPAATGQSIQDWTAQATAWQSGWNLQDALEQDVKWDRAHQSFQQAA